MRAPSLEHCVGGALRPRAVGGPGVSAAQVAPPLAREEAPVLGGVRWSRTLFVRLKHTWTRLQQEEKAALDDPVGARVRLPACAVAGTHLASLACLMPDAWRLGSPEAAERRR